MKKYIHYGSSGFDINIFCKIKNYECFSKPQGGLWASDIEAKFGWRNWCEENGFRECKKENSFIFTLSDNANILYIDNVNILNNLPQNKESFISVWVALDFEKLAEKYDAIEVSISKDPELYYKMYGWDCDSILIMNPNIIQVQR